MIIFHRDSELWVLKMGTYRSFVEGLFSWPDLVLPFISLTHESTKAKTCQLVWFIHKLSSHVFKTLWGYFTFPFLSHLGRAVEKNERDRTQKSAHLKPTARNSILWKSNDFAGFAQRIMEMITRNSRGIRLNLFLLLLVYWLAVFRTTVPNIH